MLISVFELLADAREQVASVNAAIAGAARHWLAEADLQHALTGQVGRPARRGERRSPCPPAAPRGH